MRLEFEKKKREGKENLELGTEFAFVSVAGLPSAGRPHCVSATRGCAVLYEYV